MWPKSWSFAYRNGKILVIIGQNIGIFGKYPKCRFFYTRYFHGFLSFVKSTPHCFKSRFGWLKICNMGVKIDPFLNIFEKKHFFWPKYMSTKSFIWYQNLKSVKKHLSQAIRGHPFTTSRRR